MGIIPPILRAESQNKKQKQKPQTISTKIGSLGFLLFRIIFFCRVLDIRVAYIMQPDSLYFPVFGSPHYFMFKKVFRTGKNAVMLVKPVEPRCIAFSLVPQKLRDRYDTDAFRCLRRRYNKFPIDMLVGFIHIDGTAIEIYITILLGQQLPYAQAGIIQNEEAGSCGRFV